MEFLINSDLIFLSMFVFFSSPLVLAQTPSTDTTRPVSSPEVVQVSPELKPALSNQTVSETVKLADEFKPSNKIAGDFRYRHQTIGEANKDQRRVQRINFRIGQNFFIQPDLKFTYRLMTGTTNNSGNITLGDEKTAGSPRESIGLDQAFIDYQFDENLQLFLGKMPQFFNFSGRNQIILDHDITLEGFGAKSKFEIIDKTLFADLNLGTFWIREKYDRSTNKDNPDSFLNTAQVVVNYNLDSELKLRATYGIFSFTGVKDEKPSLFLPATSDPVPERGNTLQLDGTYQSNYETKQQAIELIWAHKPFDISIFFENIKNTAAEQFNKASVYGLGLRYKKFGLSYLKEKIESDSVFALFTDSDFANGETNSKGDLIILSYKLSPNAILAYTYFKNKQNESTFPQDYSRSFLDLTVNF